MTIKNFLIQAKKMSPLSKIRQKRHRSNFIRERLDKNLWPIFIISTLVPSFIYPHSIIDQDSLGNNKVIKNSNITARNTYLEKVILEELINDPLVLPKELIVEVEDGEVILKGLVNSLFAKQAAEKNIRNRLGVRLVKNLIRVNQKPQEISDTEISSMVNEIMKNNPYISRNEIAVSVSKGKVILNGIVSTSFERDQAERAAACVEGVTTVDNRITVYKDYLLNTDSSLKNIDESDSTRQSISDSSFISNGLNYHLTFSLACSYWLDSLAENNNPQYQRNIYGNPVTGYREHFDFLGLAIFLFKALRNR